MKKLFRPINLVFTGLIIITCVMFSGCSILSSLLKNPDYIYEGDAVLVGGDDRPIRLLNQETSSDITYAQLLDFLREDYTDTLTYIGRESENPEAIPFVCSDFAETLHNNAEAVGIKAGYVSIDFADGGIGHAINAFQTTDMGLVYVDCTGKSEYSQLENGGSVDYNASWDKIAYVEFGCYYGLIPLDYAESPGYAFYEEYDQKWEEYKKLLNDYNEEVQEYNKEVQSKVFTKGSADYRYMKLWEAELIEKEKELDAFAEEIGPSRFKSLGVVSNVIIHW